MSFGRLLLLVCLLCGVARADVFRATGYRNGRPFPIKVVDVDGAYVEVKTARAFQKMREAAARDGVQLYIWSGFRSHERQAALYQRYRAGEGNLAAKPGYSNHQSGRALDLVIHHETIFEWLERNARRYGFRRTVRGEPWHWEFFGTPKQKPKPRRQARRS